MKVFRLVCLVGVLAVALAPAAGCTKKLCKTTAFCGSGQRCNVATGECEPDSGDSGVPDAAIDAQADSGAPCTNSATDCLDPIEPICDPSSRRCRACSPGSECEAAYPAAPVCDATGSCVECSDPLSHCLDPNEPICLAGQCAGCTNNSQCIALSIGKDVCDGGPCAGCATNDDCNDVSSPICDSTTRTCRACGLNSECDGITGMGACHPLTGQCVAEADVLFVAPGCGGAPNGTRGNEYCQISDAVAALNTHRVIRAAPGTYGEFALGGAGALLVLSDDPATTTVTSGLAVDLLTVSGSTNVIVRGFTFGPTFQTAVRCNGTNPATTRVTLLGNVIKNANTGGVVATSCTVDMDANLVDSNSGGGISLTTSDFTITNNFIVGNGAGSTSYGGAQITDPGAHVFAFNTIATNVATTGNAGGVRCLGSPTTISSSILYNISLPDQNGCSTDFVWETVPDGDPGFVGGGDYHLSAGSGCINGGDPSLTAIDHDFDGEPRPLDATGLPDIGADEAG